MPHMARRTPKLALKTVAGIVAVLTISATTFVTRTQAAAKCVNILYDRSPDPKYVFGRTHVIYLQNLLGHFPNIQQFIKPIELYKKGDIEKCHATFYLGTHFMSEIPAAFYTDYVNTKRTVVWAGYNIWRLPADKIKDLWNVKFLTLSRIDVKILDSKRRPEFFKYYDYKGQTFIKYGEWDTDVHDRFNAAYEVSRFELLDESAEKYVVSWARNAGTKEETPYILRNANHWYFGDSPFSFITEEDRYLIFADLLFDILEESPRYQDGKKPAIFRLEDVHPMVPQWKLYRMADLMARYKIPFSMTIIPIFAAPLDQSVTNPRERFVPITQNPEFIEWLKYAKARRASFIYHGVSHQSGNMRNPWSGTTGEDFEFWDRVRNKPMEWDSAKFVVERIEDGLGLLRDARVDVSPIAWLTPHYQASPLDYTILSQLFLWNMGRIIYFPFTKVEHAKKMPQALSIENGGSRANGSRLPYFTDLKVTYPQGLLPTGQFFPYEIYGDAYGMRLVPENVGNVQPYMNEQVHKALTVEDLTRIIKRNRVLRDNWCSFFIHPSQLDDTIDGGTGRYAGDTQKIEDLVKATQESGYEFIDLKSWIQKASLEKRPEPVEEFL